MMVLLLLLQCRYRVRPSALLSVLQGAGLAAGAAAALAPAPTRNAVLGALQESLTGLYNDQLRAMREAGLSDEVRFRTVCILLEVQLRH
jgi:demethoxyubiquinone hydroxylase (CLK1/Coq7/Cat5 family)